MSKHEAKHANEPGECVVAMLSLVMFVTGRICGGILNCTGESMAMILASSACVGRTFCRTLPSCFLQIQVKVFHDFFCVFVFAPFTPFPLPSLATVLSESYYKPSFFLKEWPGAQSGSR